MKKPLITAGIAAAVGVTGLVGVGVAHATTDSSSSGHPMSSMVNAIATKFNLDKTKVQAVFDEQHTAMEAQRTSEVKTELAQLVKDGKLTQDQMDKIVAKRAELEKERDANRASDQKLTDEQREAKRTERRAALDKWATENNVPSEYLRYVKGGRGHGGHGEGGRHGGMMRSSERT